MLVVLTTSMAFGSKTPKQVKEPTAQLAENTLHVFAFRAASLARLGGGGALL